MLDDRKTDIYDIVPDKYLPKTILYHSEKTDISSLQFPLVAKPNIGFKGYNVAVIKNNEELQTYLNDKTKAETILQEFIDLDREYSILFYCFPQSRKMGISSFVEKTFPFVIGDGKTTLNDLIDQHTNPFLNKEDCKKSNSYRLQKVIAKDEKLIIEQIGNYSRGARFISLNHRIENKLVNAIATFQNQVEGIQFFRLDLKANSIASIENGDFIVLEINGAKGEPLHIYDKHFSWFQKFKDIKRHWKIMGKIVEESKTEEAFIPAGRVWESFYRAKNLTK